MHWQKRVDEKIAPPPAQVEPSIASGPTAVDEETLIDQQEPHHPILQVEIVDVAGYRRCRWTLFYHQLPVIAQLALQFIEVYLGQL